MRSHRSHSIPTGDSLRSWSFTESNPSRSVPSGIRHIAPSGNSRMTASSTVIIFPTHEFMVTSGWSLLKYCNIGNKKSLKFQLNPKGEVQKAKTSVSPAVKSFTPFTCFNLAQLLITTAIPIHISSIQSTCFLMFGFNV